MNRRDFVKWLGRLLAALPFVALTDPGAKAENNPGNLTRIQLPIETHVIHTTDGKTIKSIYLKDILTFQGQYSDKQMLDFWQRFRGMGGKEDYFTYVWRE